MGRVIFPKGRQKIWLEKLLKQTGLSAKQLASVYGGNQRTFSDWRTGKFSIPERVFGTLLKEFNLARPKGINVVSDYWYVIKGARKGVLRRQELYGDLGTPQGRRKGGLVSQQRRRENPEAYRLLGCKIRKKFKRLQKNEKFAEVVGIILGDGGITNGQVRVTLDKRTDKEYTLFVSKLFVNVFGEKPALYKHKHDNGVDLCISGTDLVEKLKRFGLKSGNKIHRQVGFPRWIWEEIKFQKACVRGLVDTDGSFYSYKPTNRKSGSNFAICFRSYSKPLIFSMSKVLNKLKINYTVGDKRINIYSKAAMQNYFEIIGSSNAKHRRKYYKYFEYK